MSRARSARGGGRVDDGARMFAGGRPGGALHAALCVQRGARVNALVARAALVAYVVAVAACGGVSDFGRPCPSDAACDGGDVCLDGRCAPVRSAGEAGDTCRAPFPLARAAGAGPLVVGTAATTIGGARHDADLSCAAATAEPDVFFSFSLAAATGVRVHVDSDEPVTVAVRAAAPCDVDVVDGCVAGADLVVPLLDAGDYVVIVAAAAGKHVVDVAVDLVDCPAGYVPFDADTCAGFRSVDDMTVARARPFGLRLDDGRALVGAGNTIDGATDVVELFDPVRELWALRDSDRALGHAAAAKLDDGNVIFMSTDQDGIEFEELTPGDGERADAFNQVTNGDEGITIDFGHTEVVAVGTTLTLFAAGHAPERLHLDEDPVHCDEITQCPARYECVSVVTDPSEPISDECVCANAPCPPVPGNAFLISADEIGDTLGNDGASALAVRTAFSGQRILAEGFTDGVARLLEVETGFAATLPQLVKRRDSGLASADGTRVVIAGGVLSDGGHVDDTVEIFDASNGTVSPAVHTGVPVRRPMTAVLGGRVAIVGGCGGTFDDDDNCAQARADAFLVDAHSGALSRLPRLPEARAGGVAVALDDNHVLIAGGGAANPSPHAFLLERVPRGHAPALAPGPSRCEPLEQVALAGAGSMSIPGSTRGAGDKLRTLVCSSDASADSPENVLSLAIDTPVSLHATLHHDADADGSYAVWIFSGPCDARTDLACSDVDDEQAVSFNLDRLDPGTYSLVIEDDPTTDQGLLQHTGGKYELDLVWSAPESCAPDAFDPGDDSTATPRGLDVVLDQGDPTGEVTASGTLCSGDVDDFLLEYPGGFINGMFLDGAPASRALIFPAFPDVTASVAAGKPVMGATLGAPFAFDAVALQNAGPGFYVIQVNGPGDTNVNNVVQYDLSFELECVPDDGDSLISALDDVSDPAKRTSVAPGGAVAVRVCTSTDVDVVELAPPAQFDAFIEIGAEVAARLVSLDAQGHVGATLPSLVDDTTDLTLRLAAADVPARLGLVIGPVPNGDEGHIEITYEVAGAPGDNCATPLSLGSDAGSLHVDTGLFVNDLTNTSVDCTGFSDVGPDVFYSFTLQTGDTITVDAIATSGDEPDVSLYVLSACPAVDDASACAGGVDDGATDEAEHLEFTNTTGAVQTFFLGVDSYYGSAMGVDVSWSIAH